MLFGDSDDEPSVAETDAHASRFLKDDSSSSSSSSPSASSPRTRRTKGSSRRKRAKKDDDEEGSTLAPISESFIRHAREVEVATPYDLGTRRTPFVRFINLACGDIGVFSDQSYFKRPPNFGPRVSWEAYEECLNSVVFKAVASTSVVCTKAALRLGKGKDRTLDHVLLSQNKSLVLAAAEYCAALIREATKKHPSKQNMTKVDRELHAKDEADALGNLIVEMSQVKPADLAR